MNIEAAANTMSKFAEAVNRKFMNPPSAFSCRPAMVPLTHDPTISSRTHAVTHIGFFLRQ